MNRIGQALVEFIMILPVFLILMMSLFDIGNIYIKKYELNKDLDIASEYFENNKEAELSSYVSSQNLEFSFKENGNLKVLVLKKNVKINAPILSSILGRNYVIESERPIMRDSNG